MGSGYHENDVHLPPLRNCIAGRGACTHQSLGYETPQSS